MKNPVHEHIQERQRQSDLAILWHRTVTVPHLEETDCEHKGIAGPPDLNRKAHHIR
jgi:hypothetical protein